MGSAWLTKTSIFASCWNRQTETAQTRWLRRPGSSPGEATILLGEWRKWDTRSPQKTMPSWIERSNRSSPTIFAGMSQLAVEVPLDGICWGFESLYQH